MRTVELEVHLIAKSIVDPENISKWLEKKKVSPQGIQNLLGTGQKEKTDAEILVESAGRRCYMSYEPGLNPNVTQVRKDITKYITHILEVGHGSVLEHAYFSFAIENVSRVFTGEMNRHRAGMAISEGSMRYIRYDDIPFWIPTSIRTDTNDSPEITKKKEMSCEIMKQAFQDAEKHYKLMNDVWVDEFAKPDFHMKKQLTSMMRRIIPMGVATGGIWSGNIRALRHICTMRCDESAEEEICSIAVMMLDILREHEPNFFRDFLQNDKGFWRPSFFKV